MIQGYFTLILLLLLNAFFSLAEVSLIAAKKTRLKTLAQQKNKQAQTALYLIERPELFLSAVQIGITIISFLFGYASLNVFQAALTTAVQQYIDSVYVGDVVTIFIVIVATYFSSLFAEILPKRIAIVYADNISLLVAYPLYGFLKISYPLVWILSKSSNTLLAILGVTKTKDNSYTEHEIRSILSESEKQGNIDEKEKEIIDRIFSLGDRNITSLMLHRQHVEYLQLTDTVKQARAKTLKMPYSHYPVCDGDLDNIKGIISIKNLYAIRDEKKKLEKVLEKPMMIPETISAYSVLEQMKKANQKICFVVDEYGSVEGMLTLTHILEAIVGGDIVLNDKKEQPIKRIKGNRYLVDAGMSFYEFLEYFDKEDYHDLEIEESDEYDTVAGFFIFKLERIPNEGDTVEWKEFSFMIADMDDHRIDKIFVEVKLSDSAAAEEN